MKKSIFKLFTVIGVALSVTGCFKVVETGQVIKQNRQYMVENKFQ